MSKKQRLLSTLILAQLYSALTIDVNDFACNLALEKVWLVLVNSSFGHTHSSV